MPVPYRRRNVSVGGNTQPQAYRTYVREELASHENPFKKELREWVLGGEDFLRRTDPGEARTGQRRSPPWSTRN